MNAVQLLWINLIMDTFAAIALSTEPPLDSSVNGPPRKESKPVITKFVWRQVIGVSIWNSLIMLLMLLGMTMMSGGLYVDSVDPKCDPNDYELAESDSLEEGAITQEQCKYKKSCLTKIYNVFFFLQLFNEINCRKVGNKDFDVFESFFHNMWYTLVLFGTCAAHILMQIYLPGTFEY